MSGAETASQFQSIRQLSSSDLYHVRTAIYSLIQKLYLQKFDAVVCQSSSSRTKGKGNDNSDKAYCHKPFGKTEVGNVGGVEVGKVDVGKVKVGKVGQTEVEVGKAGKVEVCKMVKVQVCKLGTAQLGNLDKPTIFSELEPHVYE